MEQVWLVCWQAKRAVSWRSFRGKVVLMPRPNEPQRDGLLGGDGGGGQGAVSEHFQPAAQLALRNQAKVNRRRAGQGPANGDDNR